MKTQFRDPDGILNSLHNIGPSAEEAIFCFLLDASESFDSCMIRRSSILSAEQKTTLLQLATCPLSLRKQARLYLRRHFGPALVSSVEMLEIPRTLHKYLLFDYS